MRQRGLVAIGSAALAVAVALPGVTSHLDWFPGSSVLAQQATGDGSTDQEPLDQGPTSSGGQPAGDYEALDGPVTPTADTDYEPLDAGSVAAPAAAPAAASAPAADTSAAAPTDGGAPAQTSGTTDQTAGDQAAPAAAPAAAAPMGAWWWWSQPHRCVLAQAGRAYAAVNCADGMPVQVGFAAPGSGPTIPSVNLGAVATSTPQAGSMPPPAPTATPQATSTATAGSNPTPTPTATTSKRQGSGGASTADQNAHAASDAQTGPLVTFGPDSGTVQRVQGATLVTGEARNRIQQIIRKRNGAVRTDDQSGSNGGNGGHASASANGGSVGLHASGKRHSNKQHQSNKNNGGKKSSKQKDRKSAKAKQRAEKAQRHADRKQNRGKQGK